jgi:hypothetical protein
MLEVGKWSSKMDIIDREGDSLLNMTACGLVGGYQGFRGTRVPILHVISQETASP